MILPKHQGKANALNYGVAEAHGEIICFTDARQIIASDGLNNLIANFADPSVGCASGALIIGDNHSAPILRRRRPVLAIGKKHSKLGGTCRINGWGNGGFLCGSKRSALATSRWEQFWTMYTFRSKLRGKARELFSIRGLWLGMTSRPALRQEFRRKVRTLAGNYQLLQLAPWLLTRSNPLRLQFVCHKLLRLLVPFALVGVLVSTVWLRQGIYELALGFKLFSMRWLR